MFGFTQLEVRSYGILNLCVAIQLLINQIEQPYARSLIACDTPVNTTAGAESSGSNLCGDRLHVIGEGALLSGTGEGLENLGRFCITLFVSGLADVRGRRSAALTGWTLITASAACFFLASFIQSWAKVLFMVAQGLQGMSGIGLLGEIVAQDIGAQLGGDTTEVFTRRNMLNNVLAMIFFSGILGIQYYQITEFRFVWAFIVISGTLVLLAMFLVFPETQPEELRKNDRSKSSIDIVWGEVEVYKSIVQDNSFIRRALIEAFFKNTAAGLLTIFVPWMMAVTGYVLFDIMMMFGGSFVLSVIFGPLVAHSCRQNGHGWTLIACAWYDFLSDWLFLPFLTYSIGPIPVVILTLYVKTPMAGAGSLTDSVVTRHVSSREITKFVAMNQLCVFVCGSFSPIMFSRIFDAEAKTLLGRLAPFILCQCLKTAAFVTFWFGNRPLALEACERLQEDARKELKTD